MRSLRIRGIVLLAGAVAMLAGCSDTTKVKVGSISFVGTDGTSTVTITGTSGTQTASTTITLTVGGNCPITPYIVVNGVSQQAATATVAPGDTVNLSPQPASGTWSWTGPSGFTSSMREIDGVTLSAGANVYVATYSNSGCTSTQTFTITVGSVQSGFTLTPASTALSVATGVTKTDTIAINDADGNPVTGNVTLAASGLPVGVTATFAPNPATTGSSVVTFVAGNTIFPEQAALTSLPAGQGTYLEVTLTNDIGLLGANWSVTCQSALPPGTPLPPGQTQDTSCGTFAPMHTLSGPVPSYATSAANYVTFYTAPAAPPKGGTVTIYASSTADPSQNSSLTLNITN